MTTCVIGRVSASLIGAFVLGAVVPVVKAQTTPPLPVVKLSALPPVASRVAAESEFAAHSVATDMREAFIRALGSDSILLRPAPVPGAAFMTARPASTIELNWRQTFAYAAARGDVGIASGPSRVASKTTPAAPPLYGHVISLWKRNTEGRWQVAFDRGIELLIDVVNEMPNVPR